MSGICDICKRDECSMQHDGDDACPLYMNGKPSNYKKLFGTPERAARTFMETCAACKLDNCGRCGLDELMNHVDNYGSLLEWLKQEVDA